MFTVDIYVLWEMSPPPFCKILVRLSFMRFTVLGHRNGHFTLVGPIIESHSSSNVIEVEVGMCTPKD